MSNVFFSDDLKRSLRPPLIGLLTLFLLVGVLEAVSLMRSRTRPEITNTTRVYTYQEKVGVLAQLSTTSAEDTSVEKAEKERTVHDISAQTTAEQQPSEEDKVRLLQSL